MASARMQNLIGATLRPPSIRHPPLSCCGRRERFEEGRPEASL